MRPTLFISFLFASATFAAPPAAPEKPLNALFKQMAQKPVQVEGEIIAAKTLKVRGIIHGVNSDLTVTTQEGVPGRTIILNGKSWSSTDSTRWEKAEEIDRSFPKLVMGPVIYADTEMPPFEEVKRTEKDKDGVIIQHIRLKVPQNEAHVERPNYWIAWKNGKPLEITRAEVPVLMGGNSITIRADYCILTDTNVVRAPDATAPQKTEASTLPAPELLLAAAKKNMAAHGAWKFKATVELNKTTQLTGLIEGDNCDLSIPPDGDDGFRQKIIGNVQYATTDGGKTWDKSEPERDLLYLVRTPMKPRKDGKIPPFEIVQSTDSGNGATILHIRFKAPDAVGEEGDRPNYWIVLLDGKPSAVLRYHGPMGFQNRYITGKVEYEPADLNENGKPLITAPVSKRK
jgi:hypothetical protein